jgi:transcriptional regulator with XRE-family HTH domain
MKKNIDVIIGKNLRNARNALGWKQAELADRTGSLSRSTIAKIESFNTTGISISTISLLAETLGVPTYMLMLDRTDWQKLASISTSSTKIIDYQSSSNRISAEDVERIEVMSSSESKIIKQKAVRETNIVVDNIFRINRNVQNDATKNFEQSRTAGTGMAMAMIPKIPILNGLIANLLSS